MVFITVEIQKGYETFFEKNKVANTFSALKKGGKDFFSEKNKGAASVLGQF